MTDGKEQDTMSAETVDAPSRAVVLEELPLGAQIRIAGSDALWTKDAEGRWQRDGYTSVPPGFFAPYLAGGRVSVVEPVTPIPAVAVQAAPVEVIPEAFKVELMEIADSLDDSDLDNLMQRFGMERTEDCPVRVTAHGVTDWQPTIGVAEDNCPGIRGASVTDVDGHVEVHWRKAFEVTRTVRRGQCACDDVDSSDEDVLAELPGDYDNDTLQIERTCEND